MEADMSGALFSQEQAIRRRREGEQGYGARDVAGGVPERIAAVAAASTAAVWGSPAL